MSRLEGLWVLSGEGVREPLVLEGLGAAVTVLLGPNGAGKSTLGRALRETLWPDPSQPPLEVRSRWRLPDGAVRTGLLFGGAVRWDGPPPSVPAGGRERWTLSLRELLRADQGVDREIGRGVERALYGGVDLYGEVQRLSPSRGPTPAQLRAHSEAAAEVERALALADALAERQATEVDLREALERAKGAARALPAVDLAVERAQVLRELAAVDAALAALPEGDVPEAVLDEARQAAAAVVEAEDERAAARGEADRLREQLVALGPAGEEPQVLRARELLEALRAAPLAAERGAAEAAEAAEAALTLRWLGGGGLLPADLAPLEGAVFSRAEAREGLRAARAEEEALAGGLAPVLSPERLAQAVELLRAWPAHLPAPWPLWLGVVLAPLGLLIALLAWGATGLIGLALAPAWAAAAGWGLWALRRGAAARRRARSQWPEGVEPPARWDQAHERLVSLEVELIAAREAARLEVRRAEARALTARAQARLDAAESAVRSLLSRSRLAPDLADAALVQQVRVLESLRAAEEAARMARARVASGERELSRGLAALGGLLGVGESPEELAHASALLRQTEDRLAQSAAIRESLRSADEAVRAATRRRGVAQQRWTEIFARAGVSAGALDALEARRDQAAGRRALVHRRVPAAERAQRLTALLADHPALLGLDEEALVVEGARLRAEGERLEALARELESLEGDLRRASEGRGVREARSTLAQREAAMIDARREAAVRDAGGALARWLLTEVTAREAPPLLRRARRWLALFSRGRYQLEVGQGGALIAVDAEDQRARGLEALSDATRVQLLLAARLAALEALEGGGAPLPLFLDELLSTADPERFEAVGRALLQVAEGGRQIFYATADPEEAAAWVRLGGEGLVTVRSVPSSAPWEWAGPAPEIPMSPVYPDPEGLSAAELAARLGARPPALELPAGAWDLAFALYDDGAGVVRCRRRGISTLGSLAAAPQEEALGEALVRGARRRLRELTVVLDLVRRGRGTRVGWEQVVESEAVTAAFQERVLALLVEVGGDAGALLDGVAGLPRFRAANAERLRDHLIGLGCLDERQVLSEGEVHQRACAALSVSDEDAAPLRVLVGWVLSLTQGG
ncbi:MAG: hypothetical protein JXX28_07185 [Deltaproteobacteria bacterium]|nr:hypothetical protein [Deltaproteobacteria bacterium]